MKRLLMALFAGLSLFLFTIPSAHADTAFECSAPVVDNGSILNKDQTMQARKLVNAKMQESGAEIHVLIWKDFAPGNGKGVFSLGPGSGESNIWWSDELSKCSDWQGKSSNTPKDNIIVVGLGVDDGKALIAYGSDYDNADFNRPIYDNIKPKLQKHDVVGAIDAAMLAIPNDNEQFHITPAEVVVTVVIGIAILGVVVVSMVISDREDKARERALRGSDIPRPRPVEPPKMSRQEARKRISEIRKVLDQLDLEWLQYETSANEYYLTKPALRDKNIPVIGAYHTSMFDLRNAVNDLDDKVDEKVLIRVEKLAEGTVDKWNKANDHALKIGVNELSITERAALRRIHGMVGQLADPATPRAMWDALKEGIEREMGKLTTVPVTWKQVASLPAITTAMQVQPELMEGVA